MNMKQWLWDTRAGPKVHEEEEKDLTGKFGWEPQDLSDFASSVKTHDFN